MMSMGNSLQARLAFSVYEGYALVETLTPFYLTADS